MNEPLENFGKADKYGYENMLNLPRGSFDKFYLTLAEVNDLTRTGNKLEISSCVVPFDQV